MHACSQLAMLVKLPPWLQPVGAGQCELDVVMVAGVGFSSCSSAAAVPVSRRGFVALAIWLAFIPTRPDPVARRPPACASVSRWSVSSGSLDGLIGLAAYLGADTRNAKGCTLAT